MFGMADCVSLVSLKSKRDEVISGQIVIYFPCLIFPMDCHIPVTIWP